MQDVRELVPQDSETDDKDDRDERHAYEIVDEIVALPHVEGTNDSRAASLPRTGDPDLDETLRAPLDAELARRRHVAEQRG